MGEPHVNIVLISGRHRTTSQTFRVSQYLAARLTVLRDTGVTFEKKFAFGM
jgi:hypothetical protein